MSRRQPIPREALRVNLSERFRLVKELGGAGNRRRHRILSLVKMLIAAVLMALALWFALRNETLQAQAANWASLDVGHMALACAVIALGQGVAAVRWVVLLRRWDVPLTLSQAFRLNMVGLFLNLVFPTSVGGDVVRAFFLARHSQKTPEAVTSVFVTRFLGLVVLLLLGLFSGIVFAWSVLPHWILFALAAVILASMICGVLALRSAWLVRWSEGPDAGLVGKLRHVVAILRSLGGDHWLLFQILFLSLVIQLLAIHGYYEAARAINVRTSYLNFLVFMPIVTFVTMVPISIFGLGIRENAFIYLFQFVGITQGLSWSMSATWTLAYVLVSLVGFALFMTLEDSFFVRRVESVEPARPGPSVPETRPGGMPA